MRIHKEGFWSILLAVLFAVIVNLIIAYTVPVLLYLLIPGGIFLIGFVTQFFRNPDRTIEKQNDQLVFAPADGKVVVIEEAHEHEYFQQPQLMLSIFMSPLNVHANRFPISGKVKYTQHHHGKYLVAWHPKSSTENERFTTVIDNNGTSILVRQIAGAVARRICNYAKINQEYTQGEELGFIKFGSRVDVFLPLDAKIKVKIGQVVKGNVDVLAEF
ncbi:MAG: phosphatidylserine decarboxylase family protein [Bacteroidota bacterium]